MKKQILSLALMLICSLHLLMITQTALSQPTLTAVNSSFVAGESFAYHTGTSFTSSPLLVTGGANHTWDMSAIAVTQADTNNFVTPASTPYASFYPSATVAQDFGTGEFAYFFTSSSELSWLGNYSASTSFIYTDSRKEMSYPFTYGNTFTDTYSDGGMGTYGTTIATADGYGDLILPYGTFSNLLRVYYYTLAIDTTSGTPDTSFENIYVWYKPGLHGFIGAHYAVSNGGFIFYSTRYLDQGSVGIENLSVSKNGFSVYPNPAHDVLSVNLDETGAKTSKIELVNALGQTVKEVLAPGNATNNQFDVSDIPGGVYFLNVWSGQNKMCRKLIIE